MGVVVEDWIDERDRPGACRDGFGGRVVGAESGQAMVPMLVVMLFAVAMALAVVSVGDVVVDRARAQTAADAAALAGAADGVDAAERIAGLNDAELREWADRDGIVIVVVTVGSAQATAAADRSAAIP